MNVFVGVLESASLSICLSACLLSVCVQNFGNFVSQTPHTVLLLLYRDFVDDSSKFCMTLNLGHFR